MRLVRSFCFLNWGPLQGFTIYIITQGWNHHQNYTMNIIKKLNTQTEIVEAFRHRLYNTFRISDNDNLTSQDTEDIVNRWHQENGWGLGISPLITYIYPKVTVTAITNILNSFKEKSPGPLRHYKKFYPQSSACNSPTICRNLLRLLRHWLFPEEA